MFRPKVALDKPLYEQVRRAAAAAGYASVEEFVRHALEQEVARVAPEEPRAEDDAVERRLRGLGYLS